MLFVYEPLDDDVLAPSPQAHVTVRAARARRRVRDWDTLVHGTRGLSRGYLDVVAVGITTRECDDGLHGTSRTTISSQEDVSWLDLLA